MCLGQLSALDLSILCHCQQRYKKKGGGMEKSLSLAHTHTNKKLQKFEHLLKRKKDWKSLKEQFWKSVSWTILKSINIILVGYFSPFYD